MVSQLATNVAAGAIGVLYIRQSCLIGVAVAKRSAAAVRPETAAAALPRPNIPETYRVAGTGLLTPAMRRLGIDRSGSKNAHRSEEKRRLDRARASG
jgi:hypothetical protein